ncbi:MULTISPECIES: ImmA/IrrE family metallo-endopeptidase [Micromonospora]|uniref:ImmA/IrrE family metallo-endopeptidase n=1 Tax=Micromonospora radicis TaxID=1894971 RepID=A0A418MST5_9ACTN|nr:ImmA/IrrE family metallo-endopeptidase [Micromonospora radicis]RIV37097.1 ImmA/IrrE family metallo-endopeptidase [Micromonospora radicis]
MTLPRGFKAAAERRALELRAQLGLTPTDPLDMAAVAEHLEMKIVSAAALVDVARLEELERLQAFAFSAVTFEIKGRPFIVTNPLRPPARIVSDLAHEMSHILLEHDLSEVSEFDGVPFRTCRPDEEEQATALGGTLLLPRPLLIRAAAKGMGPDEIASRFAVSIEMARFRYNTTGVGKQVRASRR